VKQWALFLCGRYLSRKRIVLLSITAVMLCCAMLITVASLFTGFISAVESSAGDYLGDIVLSTPQGYRIEGFGELLKGLGEVSGIEAATPVLEGKGLLLTGPGQVRAAQVLGIDLQSRMRVSPLKEALVRQKAISTERVSFTPAQLPSDTVGGFVGIGLVASPDEITDEYDMKLVRSFFEQKAALTTGTLVENKSAGQQPGDSEQRYVRKVLRFTITDVVQTGVYEFDQSFVYVPIETLSSLLYPDKQPCADAIQIRLTKGTDEEVAMAMVRGAWMDFAKDRFSWAKGATVESSRKMQARLIGEYRKQLNMLMLIFGIVSFGVVLLVFCIFYLIVMTRQKDIAVVKSCGASNGSVAAMYLLFGIVNGVAGSALGAALGWLVTRNIETVEKGLTAMTGLKVWKASTYLFSKIPNEVNWTWAGWICLAALGAAVVGALIPAIAAARVRPVKLLRYE
jgi:lipoprotein-releasing system permease protein